MTNRQLFIYAMLLVALVWCSVFGLLTMVLVNLDIQRTTDWIAQHCTVRP